MDTKNTKYPTSPVIEKARAESIVGENQESMRYFDQETDAAEEKPSGVSSGNQSDFEKENLLQELSEEKDTILQPKNIKKEANTEARNKNLTTDVSEINTRHRGAKRNMWATRNNPLQESISALNEDNKIIEQKSEDGNSDMKLIQFIENEIMSINLNTKFEDILCPDSVKRALQENIVLPILFPQLFTGIRMTKNVLLCGPVRVDLNLLVKAAVSQANATLFTISVPQLISEKEFSLEDVLKQTFEIAKLHAPSLILFEQIELLGKTVGTPKELQNNRRSFTQFLALKDNLEEFHQTSDRQVVIIGTTDRPWEVIGAIRRRLDRRIYIELPNDEERKNIFEENFKRIKVSENVNLEYLVKHTRNFSSLDIEIACKEAVMLSRRRRLQNLNKINNMEDPPASNDDFRKAIRTIGRTFSDTEITNYNNWIYDFCRL